VAVTGNNLPPNGGNRAPSPARPTPDAAAKPATPPRQGVTGGSAASRPQAESKPGLAPDRNGGPGSQAQGASPQRTPSQPGAAAVSRAAAPRSPSAAVRLDAGNNQRGAADSAMPQRPLPNGTAAGNANAGEPKRMPRSPRAAIEPDTVDLPARRSVSARHPLVVIGNAIITAFVLLAVVTGVTLIIGKQRFEAPGPLQQDRVVNIPRGSGMRDIADVLSREGVIDQPWLFIGGVLVLKAREDLKAGEYEFKAHSSLRDVVATIVEGKVVAHQVGIPEGLTSDQIVARLLQDNILTGDIKEIPREGTLLPDTYNFARGVTREQMIQRMQQAQQHLLRDIWDHRSPDLPLKTPDQLVTLASLVEKETAKPDERTRVAAVFVNRLKQKMKLQSDPTIIYGLVGGKGTLGRPIMKSEILQPTPYNTYVIDGLPPGPIANPGRASLEAAANPARTRELYFVADGTGGHAFAETYEQHQKNVAHLRSLEWDQKDQVPIEDQMASPPPPAAPTASSAAPAAPSRAAPKPRSPANH
jgi:UPF0755 protein